MMDFLINELAKPLLRRAGTAVGTYLTVAGVAAHDVQTVVAAVPIVLGILLDLITSHINRKGS